MTERGFIKFSDYLYDPNREFTDPTEKVIYIDEEGEDYGQIVASMCVDEIHHDAISFYDTYILGVDYDIRVKEDECGYYIEVTLQGSPDEVIVIENGKWYCV